MLEADAVLKSALALRADDRAAVATKLLDSLEDLGEEETDLLWAQEAERRLQGFRNGNARATGAEAVAEKARKLFR